ncbi:adenylate/guanylate cyclase domain-containing protein [Reyranella sp.]|uniref:adenylate/guanylate cyclase domain-containing protein n=1 Tax=Reyranella sp. TaxID=1929291 RepID=UPI003782D245
MRSIFRNNLRLKPSILASFAFLTVPVFFTVIIVNYISNDSIARANAAELVERFRVDALANIQADFNPLKSLVRSAASIGSQDPGFYADDRSFRYFYSIVLHSTKIVSAYVGLQDGSFRQTRRVDPGVSIQGKLPPEGSQFAFRWVVPTAGQPLLDHYTFLNADLKELGSTKEVTTYDPRVRLWYRSAEQAGTTMISDPDIFAALGLIGFTVAAPFYLDGKLAGVAAADVTLDGLGTYLGERKISPGTLSYILDHQGRVIAASDLSKTYANNEGRLELRHITSLDDDLPAMAYSVRPRKSEDMYFFMHGGREYIASITTLPQEFGKRWQLFVITPVSDFTGTFQHNNIRLAIFGLLATVVQIIIIYFLTSVVSSPLERMAFKVGKIQDFGGEQLPSVRSSIREIAVLSKAIDTLDAAVKSFAAFVPMGLVTQLLQSEQKLELGGHSRFLTIFFSDLESFSTLSEEIPSQELLLRVSAYLELVTKTVNQEHGTIDKFIGDGVMAFWGAPALLDDHAWRSCVAALRIQRGMDTLNERWRAQELKPLNVRIGIHSDAVLVGNIGSRERMSYTVMGDGVNVAARLEGINKEFHTRICISHNVFKEAGERLCVRPIDDVIVKGRRSKVPIYELVGVYGADDPGLEPDEAVVKLCKMTRFAYEALIKEDNVLAARRYRDILEQFPDDPIAATVLKRLVAA